MTDGARLGEGEIVEARAIAQTTINISDWILSRQDGRLLAKYARHLEQEVENMRPHFPPNSIAGKAEVRRSGIPRCPVCGAEMYDCGDAWRCGMKHEAEINAMQAAFYIEGSDAYLSIGPHFIVNELPDGARADVLREIERRWNAAPGLRKRSEFLADRLRMYEETGGRAFEDEPAEESGYRAWGGRMGTKAAALEAQLEIEQKISEARRQALVELMGYLGLEVHRGPRGLKQRVENAIAGVTE